MRALLIDPSLFTEPYDAALNEGLMAAGVEPLWAVRPRRPAEQPQLPARNSLEIFYRRTDVWRGPRALRALAKGCAHLIGLFALLRRIGGLAPAVIHFQWLPLPLLDALAIALLRTRVPVVLTVHDTVPLNGEQGVLQRLGMHWAARLADRVIVHTEGGRRVLVDRGLRATDIVVIPHGPLRLTAAPGEPPSRDVRYTFVLFGQLKVYKGIDVLIESIGHLSPTERAASRAIVAGQPCMDLAPLRRRIETLGLASSFELRAWRHSEQEMADLFALADCFVFPYRQVDASGVYFLVRPLAKWVIASRVGAFAEHLSPDTGELCPACDATALARAMGRAIRERPQAAAPGENASWHSIGQATRTLYLGLRPPGARRRLTGTHTVAGAGP